ncbi:unannotated protein [freshwater metagenome]|uniref:Unannotated protein n=1 Tax=freshwater metagenome TaxID=449393 RepID=A0A6J7J198_9ZZZZ|nr:hypothetical protein [Actinomycetota bacterium]
MTGVRLDGIDPGDIVRVSVRGRLFHGVVRGTTPGGLEVEPIEKGISYRQVKARDVLEHWGRRGRPRAQADREVNPEQRSLDDLLDR